MFENFGLYPIKKFLVLEEESIEDRKEEIEDYLKGEKLWQKILSNGDILASFKKESKTIDDKLKKEEIREKRICQFFAQIKQKWNKFIYCPSNRK